MAILNTVNFANNAQAACETYFKAATLVCSVERLTTNAYTTKNFILQTTVATPVGKQPELKTTGLLLKEADGRPPTRLFVVTQDTIFGGISLEIIDIKTGALIAAKSGGAKLTLRDESQLENPAADIEITNTDEARGIDYRFSCIQTYRQQQDCI